MVDEDVSDKVDIDYIEHQFRSITDVRILYICTPDDGEEDDWIEDGFRYIIIHLPYQKVKKMKDVRPMMLARAKEKLGLVA